VTCILADIDRPPTALPGPAFLTAVGALSARYVARRAQLGRRSPTDSKGKRAAFAGYYAPLHFLVVRHIVRQIGAAAASPGTITDLGCGTGVASAAWALECEPRPVLQGVDRQSWSLEEAAWNWRYLGLEGRVTRGDLTRAIGRTAPRAERAARRSHDDGRAAYILAWSVNELPARERGDVLAGLEEAGRSGAALLVIEPLANAAAPWWPDWVKAWRRLDGRADEWTLTLPAATLLRDLNEAAGFRHGTVGARSLWLPPREARVLRSRP
jgi:hypothetical protein